MQLGVLKVNHVPPAWSFNHKNATEFKIASTIVIHPLLRDCLYRNLYRYRHMLVIDLDEVLVPYNHSDYHVLFAELRQLWPNKKSFQFASRDFFPEFQNESESDPETKSSTLLSRRRYVITGERPKSVHEPFYCRKWFNAHRCDKFYKVPHHIAMIHHFRNRCFSFDYQIVNRGTFTHDACAEMAKRTLLDSSLLSFKRPLIERVNAVCQQLNLF